MPVKRAEAPARQVAFPSGRDYDRRHPPDPRRPRWAFKMMAADGHMDLIYLDPVIQRKMLSENVRRVDRIDG